MKCFPGPRSLTFFHRISNSMEISFHSHLDSVRTIATKFCTCHGSCAVVACAKVCCDLMTSNGITARRSFHRIWIARKIVSETGPWKVENMGSILLGFMASQLKDIVDHTQEWKSVKWIYCGVWVQSKRCPWKFHTKFWTHTPQNMHLRGAIIWRIMLY